MEDKKPAFVPRQARDYGEAKEVNMSKAERERQEVGLTPGEVGEINTLKLKRDMTRTHLVEKAANVLAVS